MRIAVVGAGTAGKELVAKLCEMGQDVVVIDPDASALQKLAISYDVMTVEANGADPAVFEDEHIGLADLLAAVTPRDEVNLLACCWAKAAGARHTVARLSESKYVRSPLVDVSRLGVDRPLIHKEECTREIFDVLYQPGTLEVTSLLEERIAAIGFKVPPGAPLTDKPLREFRDHRWFETVRFIGHVNQGKLTIPDGDSIVRQMDDIYVVLPAAQIDPFMEWVMTGRRKHYRKVVIAGAGELGLSLARMLEDTTMETFLIDNDRRRAARAADALDKCLVLHADATAASAVREAGVDGNTVFAALTGHEEMNIVCCIQAKQLGAGFTMARVDKSEYVPIVADLNLVDRSISPNTTLIRTIVEYVRGELVENVGLFHRIPGETQEVVVKSRSKCEGTSISDLKLPRGSIVAAVQRDNDVFVPTGQHTLREGDRLAIYCLPETAGRVKSAF